MHQTNHIGRTLRLRVAKCLASVPLNIRGYGAVTRWIAGFPTCREEISLFGYNFELHLENHIDREIFLYGSYSPKELTILNILTDMLRVSGRSIIYYDIGANIGHHTLFMASRAAEVYSFEPFAPVADRLQGALTRNNIQNVRLFRVALSDHTGTHPFAAPVPGNSGTGRLVTAVAPDQGPAGTVSVSEGSKFVAENGLAPPAIVKIDVEGHELSVLSGISSLLREYKPFVLVELSSKTSELLQRDASVLRALDFANGYRIVGQPAKNEVVLDRRVVAGENMYLFVPKEQESGLRDLCSESLRQPITRFV
jgi:FkbM family methyltransferase